MSNAVTAAPAALKLSQILAPVDFSDECRRSAECAASLARHFGAEVTLFHAATISPVAYALPEAMTYTPTPESVARQLADRAARLDELLCAPDAPAARRVVVEDEPGRAIVDYAAEHRCDLIVMPTHGYGVLQRLLLGSVTLEVLRGAPCPVWTGHHCDVSPPDHYRTILCAVDLAGHSPAALAWAAAFARSYGATVEVVHAIPMSDLHCGGVYFDPEWHIEVARDARSRIDSMLRDAGFDAGVAIELGDVPGAVVARAKEIAADLLVIGRGPHCYSIVRECGCPVVAV